MDEWINVKLFMPMKTLHFVEGLERDHKSQTRGDHNELQDKGWRHGRSDVLLAVSSNSAVYGKACGHIP